MLLRKEGGRETNTKTTDSPQLRSWSSRLERGYDPVCFERTRRRPANANLQHQDCTTCNIKVDSEVQVEYLMSFFSHLLHCLTQPVENVSLRSLSAWRLRTKTQLKYDFPQILFTDTV